MIQVEGLHKTYRIHRKDPGLIGSIRSLFYRKWEHRQALIDINIQVGAGEILGLVGANGAGKTTLVKILSGIMHPGSGYVRVNGFIPYERKNEFRRNIALIMGQKAQLWWDLPAGDCFLLLKEIYRLGNDEYRRNLDYLSEVLEVRDLLGIQIRRLSLGERMKMELIAALLHSPRIVFLDEPTIGLDLTSQKAIRDFLLEYRRIQKPAMILTSHYMEDIESLCRRIVIIREGRIVYDGDLAKILSDYARHKLITVELQIPDSGMYELNLPEGEIIFREGSLVKILVDRGKIPVVTDFLLKNYSILDLSIEEEEIGSIVESIQMGRT